MYINVDVRLYKARTLLCEVSFRIFFFNFLKYNILIWNIFKYTIRMSNVY